MKTHIVFWLFTLCCIGEAYGQNVVRYSYDNAGNRIKKEIVLTRGSVASDDEKPGSYSDRIDGHDIRIYPNPTRGNLVINISNIDSDNQVSITLFSIEGKLMRKAKVDSGQAHMDIGNERNGIYLMQISIDESSTTWKIVKE